MTVSNSCMLFNCVWQQEEIIQRYKYCNDNCVMPNAYIARAIVL